MTHTLAPATTLAFLTQSLPAQAVRGGDLIVADYGTRYTIHRLDHTGLSYGAADAAIG